MKLHGSGLGAWVPEVAMMGKFGFSLEKRVGLSMFWACR